MLNSQRRKQAHELIQPLENKWLWRNQLVSSDGDRIDVIDSSTNLKIGETPDCTPGEVDRAVTASRRAFQEWSRSEGLERARLLRETAALIRENAETLAIMLALETGKALKTECEGEVKLIADIFDYFGNFGMELKGQTIPFNRKVMAMTMREPIGVIAGIVPWNMPLMFLGYKVAAPIISGNTVVVKAPELALYTILKIVSLIASLFPPNVVNVLVGYGNTTGQALIEHAGIRKVSFTGSVESGRKVYASAASNLKQVNLELGGKSPMLILPDCDLETAVDGAIAGIRFTRQAQSCTSSTRVYLPQALRDEFMDLIVERSGKLVIGDPLCEKTHTGALVSAQQHERISSMLERSYEDGLEAITSGCLPDDDEKLANGAFMQPHFFVEPPHHAEIVQKEIFGPVMCVMTYSDTDDLVQKSNDVEYGLSACIWGRDISDCLKLSQKLDVGFVQINQNAVMLPGLSYAGTKASGFGSESSLESMINSFTREKTTIINL